LAAVSDELASAVERASGAIATVHARRRLPATGVIWREDGLIVTADHVLEREEDITVSLGDDERRPATIVGRDPGSDIGVLRLTGSGFAPADLAPSDSAKVGNLVLALGTGAAAGAGRVMASFGVVSALGGSWRTARGSVVNGYIRADVALYPGFSGGPLVDTQGRVAGINSSFLARGQGIAIRAHAVTSIVDTLLTQGKIRRGYLGVTSQPVRLPDDLRQKLGFQQESALLLLAVESGSPAANAGLLMGDVLVSIGGQNISDPQDLQGALGPSSVGTATTATVVRGGERKDVSVTPSERT
jgi:S1-C subfamily serine protease